MPGHTPFRKLTGECEKAVFEEEGACFSWCEKLGASLDRESFRFDHGGPAHLVAAFHMEALPKSIRGRLWRKVFRLLAWPLRKLFNHRCWSAWQKTPDRKEYCWISPKVLVWRMDLLPENIRRIVEQRGIFAVSLMDSSMADLAVILENWPPEDAPCEVQFMARLAAARRIVEHYAGDDAAKRFDIRV
jgi:hypothetical protein